MTKSKIVRRLADVAPGVFAGHPLKVSRCIFSTAVGIDVLAAFGIQARPLSVRVDIVNLAWCDWVNSGRPGGPDGGVKAGAWILSVGYPPGTPGVEGEGYDRHGWHGHLVIEVPDQSVMVDLNMEQFSRPAKGIVMPPAAVMFLPADQDGAATFQNTAGCRMRVQTRRADRSFEDAIDWVDRGRRAAIVQEIIRGIRYSGGLKKRKKTT